MNYLDALLQARDERAHRQMMTESLSALRASLGAGNTRSLADAEREVQANPAAAFTFDEGGWARLEVLGSTYTAGRFELLRIDDAKARLPRGNGKARVFVLSGSSPLSDIGALQAFCGDGAVFQMASQFNGLESPGPYLSPVSAYLSDPTQGPRAAVSAWPAALLRHYCAPRADGSRFVQTEAEQLDFLAEACGPGVVRSGYFTAVGHEPGKLAKALEENFERIAVGLHQGAQVLLGANWSGGVQGAPLIGQVQCSTAAGGGYGAERALGAYFDPVCRTLLRAVYLGTLLGASLAGARRVLLTMIGGGVFGNRHETILEAIHWAVDHWQALSPAEDLEVVLNSRSLPADFGPQVALAQAYEGRILVLSK
ncbi:MAG: hypothetical protein RBU37_13665 [Myxococcota bacterium]|jgi:hypothetical protein|nr:hypothetical protein [Myxococcota bacterium]